MFTPPVLVTVELSTQLPSQADKSSRGSDPPVLLQPSYSFAKRIYEANSVFPFV